MNVNTGTRSADTAFQLPSIRSSARPAKSAQTIGQQRETYDQRFGGSGFPLSHPDVASSDTSYLDTGLWPLNELTVRDGGRVRSIPDR